jgi:hypothetical protein
MVKPDDTMLSAETIKSRRTTRKLALVPIDFTMRSQNDG